MARLLAGLAAIEPEARIVVLAHRRAGTAEDLRFETRRLRTPPHHRLEDVALPLELLPARLDLLHCPDVVVPRAWRGPSVATVHDVAFLEDPGLLTADARRYYGRIHASVARADRVIAVSEHTRRALERLTAASPERVRVVPNAVDPVFLAGGDPDADRAVAARLGLLEPYVLFVSTIEPRKNVPTLLAAFRRLADEGRPETLALAGADGWLSDVCYRTARELGLGRRASFLGPVAGADLPALYRRAAVLAHPALDEGFGLTPLEAMACGTPVVVSRAGALPEVVGDAGLYVEPRDVAGWAGALGRVLDDPALARRLGGRGAERARAFTIERQARETMAVYRSVLDRAAPAP